MAYNRKEYYFKKAKEENFAARSVFKLDEIDKKYRLIRSGDNVLDLGAAPGSWSQYTSKKIGTKGKIVGLDLQKINITLPNAVFIQADLRDLNLDEILRSNGMSLPVDVVLSDMAPRTTGIRITDQVRSFELCELALATAERFLKPGGHFVAKMFHSEDFEVFRKHLKERFEKIELLRPKSTRKESKEIFLIGLGYIIHSKT